MADISRLGPLGHLRAEPNQFILHYRKGRLVRRGAGLAYWFNRWSAAVAQLPVEDCETTFVLRERSSDFQEVVVQCTVAYRIADPEKAAARVNFTISPRTGAWLEPPLERLAAFWSQVAQPPARGWITGVPVVEAVRSGADAIRRSIEESLGSNPEIAAMGLAVVGIQIQRVAPTAEVEKALETPTRESIQQKADEATFQRRALAVEKERAIKENELATEIELARQQENLIRQRGANALTEIRQAAEGEQAKVEAQVARQLTAAEGYAKESSVRTDADADARRKLAAAEVEAERARVDLWAGAPPRVAAGLALQQFAAKIETIQHLNLTPDLLGETFRQFLRDQADK